MSLLPVTTGAPVQTKLFDPRFVAQQWEEVWAELQEGGKTLIALGLAHRRRILLMLGVFFVLASGIFMISLLRVAPAAAADQTPAAVGTVDATRPLELHIAQNGLVLLRRAEVLSVNGSTLTLGTAWGSTTFKWTVQTNASQYESRNFGTTFLSNDGKKVSIQDFSAGDLVTITGMLDPSAPEPTIQADSVRHTTAD